MFIPVVSKACCRVSVQRCVQLVSRAKKPVILLGSQATLPPTPVDELRAALEVSSPWEQSGPSVPHSCGQAACCVGGRLMRVPVTDLLGSQACLSPTPVGKQRAVLEVGKSLGLLVTHLLGSQASLTPTPVGKQRAGLEVGKSLGVLVTHLLGSQASLTPTPVGKQRAGLEVGKSLGVLVTHLLGSQASLTPTPADELCAALVSKSMVVSQASHTRGRAA